MSDQLILSASSVATYLRCGQQWYYGYVERLREPPTLRKALGIAAHQAVETNMRQKVWSGSDLPTEAVVDTFVDSFRKESEDVEPLAPDEEESKETRADAQASGIKVVSVYQEEVSPKITPMLVEEPVRFRVSGVDWTGTIDLVDEAIVVDEENDTESTIVRVRDLKTTSKRPSKHSGIDYTINMTGYGLGYRHHFGEIEQDVVLDYMVRTKNPYHWPIKTGGPVSDAQIERFVRIIERVKRGIDEGTFMPNGTQSGACGWCGYWRICPFTTRR